MRTRAGEYLRRPEQTVALAVVVAVNVVLIVLFHDKGWIPNDDGQYAHVADRIANGAVLSADIEELHPGYVHFVHAAALEVFGREMVSLRYPLMAVMAVQSLVVYWLFRHAQRVPAVLAALTMSAIGTLQITNPTTSLYALAATVGLAAYLANSTPRTRHRALVIGVLLGMIFLFRQLTAAFVVIGTLAFLCTERRPGEEAGPPPGPRTGGRGAQLVLVLAGLGLVGYLVTSTSRGGFVLFGVLPLVLLVWAVTHTTIGDRALIDLLARIGIGAVGAALPLVGYHVVNGSLGVWLGDTFVRSLSVGDLEHLSQGSFVWNYGIRSLRNLFTHGPVAKLNALYWLVLLLIATAVGVGLVRRLRALDGAAGRGGARVGAAGAGEPGHGEPGRFAGVPPEYAVPMIAVFHGLVSVFNQIAYYLYLTAGFSLVAGLWMWVVMSAPAGRTDAVEPRRFAAGISTERFGLVAMAGVLLVAIAFHAGQPFSRSYDQQVGGERVELVPSRVPNLGLWIAPPEEDRYVDVVAALDRLGRPGDTMFALPNTSELYFLTGLDNPFRAWNSTITILDDAELDEFAREFDEQRPALIVHDTTSVYNVDRTQDLLDRITPGYELVETVERWAIYRRIS